MKASARIPSARSAARNDPCEGSASVSGTRMEGGSVAQAQGE